MQYYNSKEKSATKEKYVLVKYGSFIMSHTSHNWLLPRILDCKQVRHLFTIKMALTALYCLIEAIDLFYFKIPGHRNADFYSQLWF